MLSNTKSYRMGKKAFSLGKRRRDNPYILASKQVLRIMWFKGYDEAKKQKAE